MRQRPPTRSRSQSHPFTDASRGERLQRVMADAGIGSRRRCEELIEAGEVTVNGLTVDQLPAWVNPRTDRIIAAGKKVVPPARNIYIMLYKPRGVVATNADPEGRPRAIDFVQHPSKARLFSIGRLDMDTAGLLLLTNDGELTNRLTHPRYEIPKIYEVTVKGALDEGDVRRIEQGISLHGQGARRKPQPRSQARTTPNSASPRPRGARLKLLKRDRDRTLLLMELREGRDEMIRSIMIDLGHPVKKLQRVQVGPLKLKGLSMGQWRELTTSELAALKKAAGSSDRRRKTATPERPSASRNRDEL